MNKLHREEMGYSVSVMVRFRENLAINKLDFKQFYSSLDILINALSDIVKAGVHPRPVQAAVAAAGAVRVLQAVMEGQSQDLGRVRICLSPAQKS